MIKPACKENGTEDKGIVYSMSQEFEQVRRAAIMNRVLKWVICLGIPFLVVLLGIAMKDGAIAGGGGIFTFIIVHSLWAYLAKNRALAVFRSMYKKEMIERALNGGVLYENMTIDYNAGMNPGFVAKSGMLGTDKFFSDCYISGVFNGVQFYQADIRNVRADRDGQHLEYDGTFIAFPTSLPSATQTNIYHKDVDCSIILPGVNSHVKIGRKDFDDVFKIATSNQPAMQTLVNDTFMNNLLYVQSLTERKIAMTVKNGWVYILMPNKKSVLKPKLFKKYDDTMKNAILMELCLPQYFINAFR